MMKEKTTNALKMLSYSFLLFNPLSRWGYGALNIRRPYKTDILLFT